MKKRRVILISGYPNSGKSTFAKRLRDEHGFHLIETDLEYVSFIRQHCKQVDTPALRQIIYQHYNQVFRPLVTDGIAAWHRYLFNQIHQASDAHMDLVVEGYQLKDCRNAFEVQLKEQGRHVFQIVVEDYGAILQPPCLTVAEVAALGTATAPKRR